MTLVIACKTKDGIVVASDGYGNRSIPEMGIIGKPTNEAKKIFDFEQCCLLAFGAGMEDYDKFLEDLVIFRNEPITYNFLKENLISYLDKKYGDDIYFLPFVGFILAGTDNHGNYRIGEFRSKVGSEVGFQFGEAENDFLCRGHFTIANKLFVDQTNLAQKSANDIAELAKEAIIETSKQPNVDVNDNVTIKLIGYDGIKEIAS